MEAFTTELKFTNSLLTLISVQLYVFLHKTGQVPLKKVSLADGDGDGDGLGLGEDSEELEDDSSELEGPTETASELGEGDGEELSELEGISELD